MFETFKSKFAKETHIYRLSNLSGHLFKPFSVARSDRLIWRCHEFGEASNSDYFLSACCEIYFPAKHLRKFSRKCTAFEDTTSNPQMPSFAKLWYHAMTHFLSAYNRRFNWILPVTQSNAPAKWGFLFFVRNSEMIYITLNLLWDKKRVACLVLVWRY